MPLLAHCSDDIMMMILLTLHSGFLQNVLNLSELKSPSAPDIIFLGKPYSEKIILHISIRLFCDRSSSFYDWELALIIYNTKVVFIVRVNMSVPTNSHGLPRISW